MSLGLPNADERSPGVGCGEMDGPGVCQAEPLRGIRDKHGLQGRLTEKGKLGSGGDGGGDPRGGGCRRVIALKAGASRRGMGRPATAIACLGFGGPGSVHRTQTASQ